MLCFDVQVLRASAHMSRGYCLLVSRDAVVDAQCGVAVDSWRSCRRVRVDALVSALCVVGECRSPDARCALVYAVVLGLGASKVSRPKPNAVPTASSALVSLSAIVLDNVRPLVRVWIDQQHAEGDDSVPLREAFDCAPMKSSARRSVRRRCRMPGTCRSVRR